MAKKKTNIIDRLSPDEALEILKALIREDKNLVGKIEKIATELLSDVDVEEVASVVYLELDSIDVEELWDRSGRTRHGYVEPQSMASEMLDEVLEPFVEDLRRYKELKSEQAKSVCMGIIKGIYQFEKESESDFVDWAVDTLAEAAGSIVEEWKGGGQTKEDLLEMEQFIEQSLPDWESFLVRIMKK
jgi:hypothetical protein